MPAPRVLVVQPTLLSYRVPFLNELGYRINELGGEFRVTDSPASPSLNARGDRVQSDFGLPVATRWISIKGHDVAVRDIGPAIKATGPDLIIVEQALHNIETYPLFAQAKRSMAEIGMWGHGRSYSTPQSLSAASVKQWLTRRTKWFFAYTQAGADHVVSEGFPRIRTTVLNNTIDTEALRSELDSLTEEEVTRIRDDLGLEAGKTALFIGGVDDAKGISFLLESVPHIAALLPGFTLLIAGDGARKSDVQTAQAQGLPIRYLGRLDGRDKAVALKAADVMAIPEWIGLVAIDSLTAGRPIVTTHHQSHSPEHEYLEDSVTCVYSTHRPLEYAHAMVSLLIDRARLSSMQDACVAKSREFSISIMADRFVEGLLAWDEMRTHSMASFRQYPT